MSDAWQYLARGEVVKAALAPLVEILGAWAYAVLWLFVVLVLYLRIGAAAAVVGLLLAGVMTYSMPPSAQPVGYLLIAASIAGILYRAYAGVRGG